LKYWLLLKKRMNRINDLFFPSYTLTFPIKLLF